MASAIVRSHRMPFVANDLIRKLKKINMKGEKEVIKTWSRGSTVTPQMIGLKISIHNGKHFKRLNVTDRMVGHKLGEFALTRKRRPHAKFIADANKKKGKGKGRSFSTCARIWCFDDKDETRSIGINSCIETTPILFSGGFDLLTPSKGLCEVVNLRDESAFVVASSRMKAGTSSGNSDNAVFWGVNMPAIGKENEVLMDRNNMISKQEDEEGSVDEGSEWRFSSWINISQKLYTVKTEMKKIFGVSTTR